ncbi:serine/threonine-protein kinase [Georgenia sp. AZ-5]|uniref:serine/threonine-protein kinase n=1 Tax=Georgenia sp. AZ-5 TaxID=3367526 RepID=UPI00375451A3
MSPRRAPSRPPELDGYTYERLLGSGGFADVYLYTQHMPRRQVAVKVLTVDAIREQAGEQLVGEADLMARLSSHASIVAVYQAGRAPDGRPYLVMQYCPLPNLAERIRTRPLGVPEALSIGVRLAGAVETAHRAGIAHRDIKPSNILTNEYGRPALADFGIAGLIGATREETAGVSVPWAPPEAVDGRPAEGVAGDVYSLAATVYTLLAGRAPFTLPGGPSSRLDHITRIRRDPVPPLDRADVPPSLEAVLARGMAKNPARRHATALDLGRALQVVEQELHLPVTDVDVPDTSWMGGAHAPVDAEGRTRTAVRGLVEVPASDVAPAGVPGAGGAAAAGEGLADGPAGNASRGSHLAPRRTARRAATALGAAAVLVAGAAVALGAGVLRGEPPAGATPSAGTGIPIPERVAAPQALTGTRTGAQVTFTWAPPPGLGKVAYVWQRTEPGADPQVHSADEHSVTVDAPGQVCLAVKVLMPDGTTSTEPATACVEGGTRPTPPDTPGG